MKAILFLFSFVLANNVLAQELLIFAGSAVKPPLDEVISEFKKARNIRVNVSYGGSGFVLSQIELSRRGDIYLPASPDFMEKAKKKNVVIPETERRIAYLLPVILVPRGNPEDISSLKDLQRSGIRIGIGNPESVCVGLYAVEIFEFNKILNGVQKNIIAQFESCEKTASALALGAVDAIIGWDVFEKWHPEKIEAIPLKPEEIPRIAYIPVAVSRFTMNRELAEYFIDFLISDKAKQIFLKHGYEISEKEIRKKAPNAKIGGEYAPEEWNTGK